MTSQRKDVLGLIGNTPLFEVTKLERGVSRLFLKLENQNPGGSIKDRIGLSMIEAAEAAGKLAPGGTIVEATAGNTGLGLALVAAQKGYRLILVVPDKMAREKIHHLTALGAKVVLTRSDVGKGHAEYYQDKAAAIAAATQGAYYIDQFNNPANPLAHEQGTGPELWAQMEQRIDAVVCGVGSSGTITGLSRFFARVSPGTDIVLADPHGSVLADYIATGKIGAAGSWAVEGIGEDFIPPIADLSRVRHAFTIGDEESFATARALLRQEGILAGSSTGTLVAAALRYCRAQREPKRVATFVCDSGAKYLSKMFNDAWLAEQGFGERTRHNDLRDLIARPHAEGATISVAPADTLAIAYGRMRAADISQLPVLDGERIVGLIDESDILLSVTGGGDCDAAFACPVSSAMTARLETLPVDAPLSVLPPIFDRGMVAIVVEQGRFLGLITRVDFINFMRLRLK